MSKDETELEVEIEWVAEPSGEVCVATARDGDEVKARVRVEADAETIADYQSERGSWEEYRSEVEKGARENVLNKARQVVNA